MSEVSNLEADTKSAKTPPVAQPKNLEARLAEIKKKTKELHENLSEEQPQAREENAQAVAALHKAEGLDAFDIEAWTSAMPQIKALLEKEQSALAQKADA